MFGKNILQKRRQKTNKQTNKQKPKKLFLDQGKLREFLNSRHSKERPSLVLLVEGN
jgi:hypothetical protein